jgi:hypothetical protein
MVTVPSFTPVTNPVPFTVATFVFDDDQVALFVMPCVLPSANVPVAVNCTGAPISTRAFAGTTEIDTSVGGLTVKPVEFVTAPEDALMVVLPCAAAVAFPEAEIVAAPVLDEAHVTAFVKSCLLPLLKVPSAVNCWVCPTSIDALPGVIDREVRVPGFEFPVEPLEPFPLLHPHEPNSAPQNKASVTDSTECPLTLTMDEFLCLLLLKFQSYQPYILVQ